MITKNPNGMITNTSNECTNSGTGGGGSTPTKITWDNVIDKPRLANKLEITSFTLDLKDTNDSVINSIELLSNEEVEQILNNIN